MPFYPTEILLLVYISLLTLAHPFASPFNCLFNTCLVETNKTKVYSKQTKQFDFIFHAHFSNLAFKCDEVYVIFHTFTKKNKILFSRLMRKLLKLEQNIH